MGAEAEKLKQDERRFEMAEKKGEEYSGKTLSASTSILTTTSMRTARGGARGGASSAAFTACSTVASIRTVS